jgi:hypothetical protein
MKKCIFCGRLTKIFVYLGTYNIHPTYEKYRVEPICIECNISLHLQNKSLWDDEVGSYIKFLKGEKKC